MEERHIVRAITPYQSSLHLDSFSA